MIRRVSLAALCLLLLRASADARSLSSLLEPSRDTLGPVDVVAAPFVAELQRTISRGTDFPATATTPGFTYKLNEDLQIYERSTVSLGSAFLDRADTVGKGKFDLGLAYLHAAFNKFDGDDLDGLTESVLFTRKVAPFLDAATITFDNLEIVTNALYFSGTYGLTDSWDVNLLMPLFITTVDVTQTLDTTLTGVAPPTSADGTAVGPGDLQIRTKYRFLDNDSLKSAATFALRVPTGDEADFQGIGDTTVLPGIVASGVLGRFDLHGNLGFEFDVNELDESRFYYGLGASYGVLDDLTLSLDILGNSQVVDAHVTQVVDYGIGEVREITRTQAQGGTQFELEPVGDQTRITSNLGRLDVVDLAVGIKYNLFGKVVLFANAVVPLTQDGIRAPVIPACGVEASF